MKRVLVCFAMVIMALAGVSLYAQAENVTGTWTMSVHEGMSLRLVLAQNGSDVTGTVENPHGGEFEVKGEFSKGTLKFSCSGDETHPIQFSASATLKSDGSLAGILSGTIGDMAWTATRTSASDTLPLP
jgi:hypothetical protein